MSDAPLELPRRGLAPDLLRHARGRLSPCRSSRSSWRWSSARSSSSPRSSSCPANLRPGPAARGLRRPLPGSPSAASTPSSTRWSSTTPALLGRPGGRRSASRPGSSTSAPRASSCWAPSARSRSGWRSSTWPPLRRHPARARSPACSSARPGASSRASSRRPRAPMRWSPRSCSTTSPSAVLAVDGQRAAATRPARPRRSRGCRQRRPADPHRPQRPPGHPHRRSPPCRWCASCCTARRSASRSAPSGANPEAARYAGMRPRFLIVLTMSLAGLLAGAGRGGRGCSA